jgi:hypothetical protein
LQALFMDYGYCYVGIRWHIDRLTSWRNVPPSDEEYAYIKSFSDGLSGNGHFLRQGGAAIGQGRGSIAQGVRQPHGAPAGNALGDLGLGAAQ